MPGTDPAPRPARPRRPRVRWAVAALAAVAGVALLTPYAVALYHWRQARHALAEYDFAVARSHLEACLFVWSRDPETRFTLARTCRRGGDFEASRAHLAEAEKLGHPVRLVELEKLLLRAQAGLAESVEPALLGLAAAEPDQEGVVLEGLTAGYLRSNALDRAHRCGKAWAEKYPDDAQARLWLGRVLERGLQHDRAAEEYAKALELRPGHAEAHLLRAEVLAFRRRYTEALPHFEAFLRSEPRHAAALAGLARCQRSLSRLDDARATVDRLLATDRGHPVGLLVRGQLAQDDDRPEEALDWLRRAQAAAPHDRDANVALAAALRRLRHDDEAREYEEKSRRIEQDLRRMEEITREVLARPNDAALRQEAGRILAGLGRDAEALQWLVSALLLDRGHEPTRKLLAECLQRLGDPNLVEAYRRVLAP